MNKTALVNITLKTTDKRILKSPAVKAYLRMVNKKINREIMEERFQERLAESIALGAPFVVYKKE